jgi:hypothetical protein
MVATIAATIPMLVMTLAMVLSPKLQSHVMWRLIIKMGVNLR